MSLKSATFIQIGDIHFPEARRESFADRKDESFPPAIAEITTMRPLTCVTRALTRELEQKPNGLLFSGDITSKGSVDGYNDCLDYLNQIINFARWKEHTIHAVPGNHDVDRSKIDPTGRDLYGKFSAFEEVWLRFDLPILATRTLRSTRISCGQGAVRIHSLNSSLGCGEKRFLPPEIEPELTKLFTEYATKVGEAKAFALLGDTLDTPAFNQDDIEEICQQISASEPKHISLVLSHHNILPQVLPRLAMYTELINAGVMRSRFSHLERPIIYCHGHIHDHPLEVIHEPEYERSRVVCVSAPTFSEGFNVIRIEFSSQGFAIGCIVTSHRLSPRDCEVRRYPVRIPLISAHSDAKRIADPRIWRLLAVLGDQATRLPDIVSKWNDPTVAETLVSTLVQEAEWLGMLLVQDREHEPQFWVINKVI